MEDKYIIITIIIVGFLMIASLIGMGLVVGFWNSGQDDRYLRLENQTDSLWVVVNHLEATMDSLRTTVTSTGVITCWNNDMITKTATERASSDRGRVLATSDYNE